MQSLRCHHNFDIHSTLKGHTAALLTGWQCQMQVLVKSVGGEVHGLKQASEVGMQVLKLF